MLSLYLSMLNDEESNEKLTLIFTENKDWMLRYAYSLLDNKNLAMDAVHNTFLKLVEIFRTPSSESKDITKSFLYVSVKNSCINILREEDRLKLESFDLFANYSSGDSVEENAIADDSYERLVNIINSLPEIYSDILVLHFVCDMSLKEISNLLKIPLKTIYTRFSRGKKIIKKKFGGAK